jgi:hypothetical protein
MLVVQHNGHGQDPKPVWCTERSGEFQKLGEGDAGCINRERAWNVAGVSRIP